MGPVASVIVKQITSNPALAAAVFSQLKNMNYHIPGLRECQEKLTACEAKPACEAKQSFGRSRKKHKPKKVNTTKTKRNYRPNKSRKR